MNKRIVAALRVVAAKTYYHGSPEPLELGPLKDINKTWTAFDNKIMKEPFWLTPDLSFAKQHGRRGHVYEVSFNIPTEKIFGDRDLVDSEIKNFSWGRGAVNEGRLLYEALENEELFKEASNWEGVFQDIVAEDYDVIETKEFIDWATANGFKAAYVFGDGPRNLAIFDPTDVVIQKEVTTTAALKSVVGELTDEDLEFLGKVLDGWGSGYGDLSDIAYFERLAKKVDPEFSEYPYEIYRGQSLDEEELEELKDGGKYKVAAGSWSVDEDEAKRFAQGWRDQDKIGVVFSYTPKADEVILNLYELVQDAALMKHTPQATIDTLESEREIIMDNLTLDSSNIYVDADVDLEIFG